MDEKRSVEEGSLDASQPASMGLFDPATPPVKSSGLLIIIVVSLALHCVFVFLVAFMDLSWQPPQVQTDIPVELVNEEQAQKAARKNGDPAAEEAEAKSESQAKSVSGKGKPPSEPDKAESDLKAAADKAEALQSAEKAQARAKANDAADKTEKAAPAQPAADKPALPKSDPPQPPAKAEPTAPDKAVEKPSAKPAKTQAAKVQPAKSESVKSQPAQAAPEPSQKQADLQQPKPVDPAPRPMAPSTPDSQNKLPAGNPSNLRQQAAASHDLAPPHAKGLNPGELAQAIAVPGATNDASAEPVSYELLVFSLLERAKQYPESALRRGARGNVTLSFSVDDQGQPQDIEILESSGEADLDVEGLSMIMRAAPFPVPPAGAPRTFAPEVRFNFR
jgi:colicin import membrane protein